MHAHFLFLKIILKHKTITTTVSKIAVRNDFMTTMYVLIVRMFTTGVPSGGGPSEIMIMKLQLCIEFTTLSLPGHTEVLPKDN